MPSSSSSASAGADLSAPTSSAASPSSSSPRPWGRRGGGGGDNKRRSRAAAWEWERAYLLACAAGLMVDPLFLYAACVSGPLMCVFLDAWFAAAVTALRCAVDAAHAWNLVLRLRDAHCVAAPMRRARRRGG
ncbi:hypothetical protein PR202_gb04539 [Eleusine coracana subsp. coracana]|uniref:Uncharacterized protein n=1 Tax=Eleusine coracana subsp. coracana TaxID=191504 RepID=A0AAV5E4Z4_ELECO|nr:hypothetical protein PR202_gb04539 [Eleusine coracana subsp. coracana]